MRIDMYDTQRLSVFSQPHYEEETREERFRRLKRISEITGIRYCVVYARDERRRALRRSQITPTKEQFWSNKQSLPKRG